MTDSPFLRNRRRKLARKAGQLATAGRLQEPSPDTDAGMEYAVMKVRLTEGLRILQSVESHQARKPLKARMAKDLADWVDGVIEADEAVQDEILLTSMVWAIDYGDFERAVELGAFALKHGLTMPDRYNRSVACFLREDIAEVAIDAPEAVDHALLVRIDELTQDADMPDAAKAKLHKALGRSWAAKAAAFDPSADNAPAGGAAAYWQQAHGHLTRALKLDRKAGVKKDIEQVERRIRELRVGDQDGTATEGEGGDQDGDRQPAPPSEPTGNAKQPKRQRTPPQKKKNSPRPAKPRR